MGRSFWHDENTTRAKELWKAGESAGLIASELGCSRNAVIGKIHREGLAQRDKGHPALPARSGAGRRILRPGKGRGDTGGGAITALMARLKTELIELPTSSEAARTSYGPGKQLVELLDSDCHFPIGDPAKPGFFFCAAPRLGAGVPYCASHARASYSPTKGAR